MKAAALHDHGDALERAAHEVTLVPGRPGLGEARNCGLRNADCGLDRVGYRPKTGAQDDRHARAKAAEPRGNRVRGAARSEEHTSELQSRLHLVCRLLLEKKKKKTSHKD